jgi:hypothetical protein
MSTLTDLGNGIARKDTVPNAQYLGPGGFMSTPGLENPVISTHIRPMGIDEYLPITPATTTNPLYAVFTGVTDETGSEPETVCDDGPTGLMKGASFTNVFGRLIRSTPVIDVGQLAETVRGQNTDLRLLADRGAPGGNLMLRTDVIPTDDILRSATSGAMFVAATLIQRELSRMIWTGNPATNGSPNSGRLDFAGLDLQVGTGRVDATSGVAVSSLDSYVKNANYATLSEYNIVAHLQDMEYRLRTRASRLFGSAEFALVMRPEMWHELTTLWPIQYNTQAAGFVLPGASNVSVSINADSVVSARDEMRRTLRITINGNSYPVILDDGITEENPTTQGITPGALQAGEFASTIYMLPLTVAGGFRSLRLEYLDFRIGINDARRVGFDTEMMWTDDGRYLWTAEKKHSCFWFRARIEPRVLLHTPHLAGKIQRLVVSPMSHIESPYPDSPYHVNGGLSVRPVETLFTPWS